MLGTDVKIKITGIQNEEVNENFEYTEELIYENVCAKMIEIKNNKFTSEISQNQPVQQFAFMICSTLKNVRIGHHISYTDNFGNIKLIITVRPKFIEFEDGEKFIKLTAEIIGDSN